MRDGKEYVVGIFYYFRLLIKNIYCLKEDKNENKIYKQEFLFSFGIFGCD